MKTFTSRKKTITMNDIAKESGVSVATVSRYINNDTFVDDKKAKKIEEIIKKYDYKPNRIARGLKMRKTMQIMLVVPDIKNPYYAKMYDVIQSIAYKEKYTVLLFNTNEDHTNEIEAIRLVSELNCDGIIFCSTSDDQKIIDGLLKLNKPIVSSSSFEKKLFDTVHGIKPGQGVYLATSYLASKGHKKIAFAGGNPESILNNRRFSGYKRALKENDLELNKKYCFSKSFTLEGGYQAGEYFATLDERPTAIACANDMIAIGIIQYFNSVGIDIPKDISIVGMDNIAMSEIVKPSLTTVINDSSEFAEKATKLLFDRIHGYDGPAREAVCTRLLIERNSVQSI